MKVHWRQANNGKEDPNKVNSSVDCSCIVAVKEAKNRRQEYEDKVCYLENANDKVAKRKWASECELHFADIRRNRGNGSLEHTHLSIPRRTKDTRVTRMQGQGTHCVGKFGDVGVNSIVGFTPIHRWWATVHDGRWGHHVVAVFLGVNLYWQLEQWKMENGK